MKKNRTFEEALEANPLRPLVRDRMEILPLARAAGAKSFESALQVACANGDSTRQLLRRFKCSELVAVDKNEALIREASRRHAGLAAGFMVMDIPKLEFSDKRFDVVFNLAELHNYAGWREGLAEMARVLKPGGMLLMDELSIESFTYGAGPWFMRRTVHPYESMFTAGELRAALADSGLEPGYFKTRNPLGMLPYLVIAAQKA